MYISHLAALGILFILSSLDPLLGCLLGGLLYCNILTLDPLLVLPEPRLSLVTHHLQ